MLCWIKLKAFRVNMVTDASRTEDWKQMTQTEKMTETSQGFFGFFFWRGMEK